VNRIEPFDIDVNARMFCLEQISDNFQLFAENCERKRSRSTYRRKSNLFRNRNDVYVGRRQELGLENDGYEFIDVVFADNKAVDGVHGTA
jgi:hypothetical protein